VLVSIITPSFNQGQFIERTILSVKNQNYGNIEHIIFDNNSNDQTSRILKKYRDSIAYKIEADRGQSDAINKGFKSAKGDIIGWLNSDDIYHPNILKSVVEYFTNNPSVVALYGDANHIDVNDEQINYYNTEDWNTERLKDVCFICQPSLFFRREIFSNIGYLNEDLHFCMDYEFWVRFAKHNLYVHKINLLIAGSRLYAENKTLGSRLKVHIEINDMLRKQYEFTPDRWIFNYAHVKTDELGIKRENKFAYLFFILIFTLYGSLRWNKKISKQFIFLAFKLYGIIK
jgi:glycosyltransferase involved in cell wall biosynthesis